VANSMSIFFPNFRASKTLITFLRMIELTIFSEKSPKCATPIEV
jgi:hypothetical protein